MFTTVNQQLQNIADDINATGKDYRITPREIFRGLGFERRTKDTCKVADRFLEQNNLTVKPHYNDVWIDAYVLLTPKEKAQRKSMEDPIKRLRVLKAATNRPTAVNADARLTEALTLMMMNGYSQLPVITNNLRNVTGYISWQTIGEARA